MIPILFEELLPHSQQLIFDNLNAFLAPQQRAHTAALVHAHKHSAWVQVGFGVGGEGLLVDCELQVHEGDVCGQGGEGQLA